MQFGYTTVTLNVLIICSSFRSVINTKCSDILVSPVLFNVIGYQQNIPLELDDVSESESIRFEIQFTGEIKSLQSSWGNVRTNDSKTFLLDIYINNQNKLLIINHTKYIPVFLQYNNENVHPEIKKIILNGEIICSDNGDSVENGSSSKTFWSPPYFIYPPVPHLMGKHNLSDDDIPNEPINHDNSEKDTGGIIDSSEHQLSMGNHFEYTQYEDSDEQEEPAKQNTSPNKNYEGYDEKEKLFNNPWRSGGHSKENPDKQENLSTQNPLMEQDFANRGSEDIGVKQESLEQKPSRKKPFIYTLYEDSDEQEKLTKQNTLSNENSSNRHYKDSDEKLFDKSPLAGDTEENSDDQEDLSTQNPMLEENFDNKLNEDIDVKEESLEPQPPKKKQFNYTRYEFSDEQEEPATQNSLSNENSLNKQYEGSDTKVEFFDKSPLAGDTEENSDDQEDLSTQHPFSVEIFANRSYEDIDINEESLKQMPPTK